MIYQHIANRQISKCQLETMQKGNMNLYQIVPKELCLQKLLTKLTSFTRIYLIQILNRAV
jgi:hypothetical protein